MQLDVRTVDATGLAVRREALIDLLIHTVETARQSASCCRCQRGGRRLLDGLQASLANGPRLLWIANDEARLIGTAQLELTVKKTA